MKNTLATLAAMYALAGCASEPKEAPRTTYIPSPVAVSIPTPITETVSPQRPSIPDYVGGTRAGAVTEKNTTYRLETIVLAKERDKEFIAQPNSHKEDGELEFRLTPYADAIISRDSSGRITKIISDSTYIPTQFKVEDKSTKEHNPAEEITFKPLGGLSTRTPKPRRITSDVEENARTEKDAEFNMPTARINGQELYVAIQRNNDGTVEKIYLVPVEGSELGVRVGDRAITLRNPGRIYELTEVTDYAEREEKPASSPAIPAVLSVK